MNRTQQLRDIGQSVWLDGITREMLDKQTLRRYVDEFAITGLTSNPTIFDEAIGKSQAYDAGIRDKAKSGKSGEALFLELALEDLRRAADLFRPAYDATDGVEGTPEGVEAIEESIFAGVPINVTLLFSCEQYLASAEAFMRGIERRIAAHRDPCVASVASLFVSRWDKAVSGKVPSELKNRLGIAIAGRTYRAHREMLASAR